MATMSETSVTQVTQLKTPSEEDVAEINKLMSDGKRNYICKQSKLALDCFVQLCEKLSKFYGQESEKCVEAYLYYGKTLLDIARVENSVLGHAVKDAPVFGTDTETEDDNLEEVLTEDEEVTPEVKDDIKNQVVEALRTENAYNESTDEDTEEEMDDVGEETEDETKSDEVAEKEVAEKEETSMEAGDTKKDEASTGPEIETGINAEENAGKDEMDVDNEKSINIETNDEHDDEDVTNMELAWEMLELTTVICRRQLMEKKAEEKEVKTTLAESKYCLAQISLETERYEDSVNDFKECLSIYEEVLEDKHDRRIPEVHYNIAVAFSFDKKYSDAIKEFQVVVDLLKARAGDLEKKVKESEKKSDDEKPDEFEKWRKEIAELNDLILLDMKAKIDGARESKKLLEETIETVKSAAGKLLSLSDVESDFEKGFDGTSGVVKVVHDCNDKIRSVKRLNDDETSVVCEKKLKPEENATTTPDVEIAK